MALDYDLVLDTFIQIARDSVGTELSSIGAVGFEIPAVIRSRQGGAKPDYPYIQIDILNTAKTSGWKLATGVDDGDIPWVDTHYKILMQYTVYGGNANSIAHDLEGYFRLESVLNKISTDTTGQLEDTFNVISLPSNLATDNLEVAAFNLTFNINDRLSDTQTGVFSRIVLDGELKKNIEDLTPLSLDIDEQSTSHPP